MAWSARGINQDHVPGDRIENDHGAVPSRADIEKTLCACFWSGLVVVVVRRLLPRGALALESRTRRYIRAPPALEKSADPTKSADQPEHGRCHMVNGPLTKNPARLSTERGLSKGPDTQRGRSGPDMRRVKQ